jgi:antitoxin VapB
VGTGDWKVGSGMWNFFDDISLGMYQLPGYINFYISAEYLSTEFAMTVTAKIFISGRSQAVRLPREFRFEGKEVFIRRDPLTGDVILSRCPDSWSGLFDLDATTEVPEDYLGEEDRRQQEQVRDPFDGWEEPE